MAGKNHTLYTNSSQQNDLDGILFSNKTPNSNYSQSFLGSPPMFMGYHPSVSDYTKKYGTIPIQMTSGNKTQEELEHLIGEIPFPHEDASMTSFSNSTYSNNTPQKPYNRSGDPSPKNGPTIRQFNDDRSKPPVGRSSVRSSVQNSHRASERGGKENLPSNRMFFEQHSQGNPLDERINSAKDTLTPDKMNKFMDWSKNHIAPGDGRTIFPQIIAPSIEISGDVSQKLQEIREDLSNEDNKFDAQSDYINSRQDISMKSNANVSSNAAEDSKLRILNKQLTGELQKLENEFNLQKKLYKKLEQENNYLSQRISEQEEQLRFLQDKYQDKSPLDVLRGKNLENAKVQIKQLKSLLEKKEDKVTELTTALQRVKSSEESLKENLDKELKNLQHEASRHKIVAESQKKRVGELEQENHELKQAIKELERQFKAKIENMDSQTQARVNELNFRKEEIAQRDMMIAQLNHTINELKNRLQGSQNEINEREQQFMQLKKQYEILFNQKNLGQIQPRDGEERQFEEQLMQELERQKEKFTSQINQLKQKNAELMEELQKERVKTSKFQNFQSQSSNVTENDLQGLLGFDTSMHSQIDRQQKSMNISRDYESQRPVAKSCMTQGTQCNFATEMVEKTLISLSIYDTGLPIESALKKLETEYLKMKEKYTKNSRELENHKFEYEKLVFEYQNTRDELERTTMMLNQLQKEYDTARFEESEDKKSSNSQKQESETIAKYKSQVQSLGDRLLEAQEEIMTLSEGKEDLEKRVLYLQAELKNRDAEIQRIQEESENDRLLQETASELKIKSEEAIQSMKRRVEELEARNTQLVAELREQDRQLQQHKEQLDDTQSHQELNKNLEKINKELHSSLERKVHSLEDEVSRLSHELSTKDHMIASLKNELTNLEYSLEDARRNKADLEKIYEENYQRLKEHTKSIEADNMKYLKETQELREKLRGTSSQVDELQKGGNGAQAELERMKKQLKDEIERIEYIEKIKNELERTNKEYCNQIAEYEAEVKELRAAQERLNEESNDMRAKILEMELFSQKEKNKSIKAVESEKDAIAAKVEEYKSQLALKSTEIKHLLDKLRENEKKIESLQNELNAKAKETEKSKKETLQNEKNADVLRKEKNALKEKIETLEEKIEKDAGVVKEKEQALKQLEGKIEQNNQLLKEKDKKNLELFTQNKNLQEKIKVLQEANNAVKAELEKKGRALGQKDKELKSATANAEKIEGKNLELQNMNEELKNKIIKLENEISILRINAETNLDDDEISSSSVKKSKKKETKATQKAAEEEQQRMQMQAQIQKELDSKREELEEMRREFQNFLNEFKRREGEFEHIKEKLLERIVSLNDKISSYEKKCGSLVEENNYLNTQVLLQQKNNTILQEKISTLEGTMRKSMDYGASYIEDEEDLPTEQRHIIENNATKNGRRNGYNQLTTQRAGKSQLENSYSEPDELKLPPGYQDGENVFQSIIKKPAQGSTTGKKPSRLQDFAEISPMLCPEMLSTEETVGLVLEVLRRADQSTEIANALKENVNFLQLTGTLRKEMGRDYDDRDSSFQSNTRRTKRTKFSEVDAYDEN